MIGATAALRERHPGARWTRPEQLHLTIAFLGAMPPAEVPRLEDAIAAVVQGWAPFEVTMGPGGGFTDREDGGVAWLGVAGGHDEVVRLSLDLDAAMGTCAFERRPPRPHLTLARHVSKALLDELRELAPSLALGWTLDNVALFNSHTEPIGARYEELARHHLASPAEPRPRH